MRINKTICNRAINDEEHPYYKISLDIKKDKRLYSIDKGILFDILANNYESDDPYVLHTTYIQKVSGVSKKLFGESMDRLKLCGYIQEYQKEPYHGWIINEVPIELSEKSIDKLLSKIKLKDDNRKNKGNVFTKNK